MTFHIKSSSYHHYACTMSTIHVLCLLCLYYAYYACTMPTMLTMPIYNYRVGDCLVPSTEIFIKQPNHKIFGASTSFGRSAKKKIIIQR